MESYIQEIVTSLLSFSYRQKADYSCTGHDIVKKDNRRPEWHKLPVIAQTLQTNKEACLRLSCEQVQHIYGEGGITRFVTMP